jgi:nucleoside-diphosphate-sugar epimerase
MEKNKAKILLLGSGFVGQALLKAWQQESVEVVVTTTSSEKKEKFLAAGIQAVQVIGRDQNALSSLLEDKDALIVTIAPHDSAFYRETYLETAKTLAEIVKKRERPLYIMYTSSTSVYGDWQGKQVDEDMPLLANTENGRILIETEQVYMKMQKDGIKVCILRLAGIYGKGRELERRAQMMSGAKMTFGEAPTNHISLDNIVKAIMWCYKRQLTGVYNLAEDFHPTKKTLYEALCKKQNLPPPIWQEHVLPGVEQRNTSCVVLSEKIKRTGFSFSAPSSMSLEGISQA